MPSFRHEDLAAQSRDLSARDSRDSRARLARTRSQGPHDLYRDGHQVAQPVFGGGMKRAQSETALFFNENYGRYGRELPIMALSDICSEYMSS